MSVFSSIVLTSPTVVGALAAGAVCWAGFIVRPEPAQRRVRLLAAPGPHPAGLDVEPSRGPLRGLGRDSGRHVTAELPAIVEVMGVALATGLSISASLQLALHHCDPASDIRRRLTPGADRSLDDALDSFGAAGGPRARAFAAAVSGSLRTGVPLAPELDRLGRELRDEMRRRLEAKVRRLPVMLLFPLVLCVLPALGLVAIVPVLVAAFGM